MDQNMKPVQDNFSELLKDLISMSADVIEKSNIYLQDVQVLDTLSYNTVKNKIGTLLNRINTNVTSFIGTFESSVNKFKIETETKTPTKKKFNLSLKNCRNTELDIDLTHSDSEGETHKNNKVKDSVQNKDTTRQEVDLNGTKDADTASDTDSEKTILNFDVNVTNKGGDHEDDFMKQLDALESWDNEMTNDKSRNSLKRSSMSFDFSDLDEDLNVGMSKQDISEGRKSKITSVETHKEEQRANLELLDLLNAAIPDTQSYTKEEEAEEALRILDEERSLSETSESSLESDDEWKSTSEDELESSENENKEESEEEPEYDLKEVSIELKERVDEMTEAQIDRFCNLHNINKRKCVKELKIKRKIKRRRIRLLSTSSSSSDSSNRSSLASSTPDLVIDSQRSLSPNVPDVTVLADELVGMLDKKSDTSSSSSDEEPAKKTKEKTSKDKKETAEESVRSDEEDSDGQIVIRRTQKKRGTWRDEIFFDDDTSEEEISVLNDPFSEKIEEVDEDSKENVKVKIIDGDTLVITDSAEDNSDDDVTFVAEEFGDENSAGRGRRRLRTILSDHELDVLTQKAKTEEVERIQRLEEHSRNIEKLQSQREEFVLDVEMDTGKPLVTVDYQIAEMLKPHQKDGIKFMWEACYESVKALKKNEGTGCILAHCMGLGKTLQVIALIHTLFKHSNTQTKHVLVTCPLSIVANWRNEFRKTFRLLSAPTNIKQYFIIQGDLTEKIRSIDNWRQTGGVLVMGYESFQILTNDKLSSRVSPMQKTNTYEALVNPGPDLIVCDEGHQLKNDKTLRTAALMQVKTKRRIILTGTPLQNNLMEYFYMVQVVKPHLLGNLNEFKNMFANPIRNGQFHDSGPQDIKLMKKRTHVLTKLLKKTVHRAEAKILASYLPEITDYTIFIKLTPLQVRMYETYINLVTGQTMDLKRGFFTDVMLLNFNNLHPYTTQLHFTKPVKAKRKKKNELDDEPEVEEGHVAKDWYKSLMPEDISAAMNYSTKLKVIFDIIDECVKLGDKVLVFAKHLVELDVIEHFLRTGGTTNFKEWRPNTDYYRMQGSTPVETRDKLCQKFNTDITAKVFLLTHGVGGLGLNLTGANRVIMIGSNHNPSVDTQSMYRVYRFGQQKKCYIYRLISLGTMEEKIYHRCVVKLHLSGTVVDKLHFVRTFTSSHLKEMYKYDFTAYATERPIPSVPTDKLLATLVQNNVEIFKYHLHNSLLENRPEEELTEEDKKLAWDEFNAMEENAKKAALNPVINPLALPIFPANPNYPFNRFNQLSNQMRPHQDLNNSRFVINPAVQNRIRSFVPRMLTQSNNNPPNSNASFPTVDLVNQNQDWRAVHNYVPNRPHEEAPPSGEFNYALNRVV